MDVSWSDWQVVEAALRCGSFTAAAANLGVGQATVSRRVAALEAALGHRLFDRHRSGLVPTAAARRLAPHLEGLLTAANGAERAIEGLEQVAEGEVCIAGPPGLCVDWMPALAQRLRARHPGIRLTVLADIRPRDLDRREADIALRMVPTTRGDLLSRRLLTLRGGLFAAPAYVADLPDPPEPADLRIVQYADELADIPLARFLASLGAQVAFRSNDYLVQRAAIQAGLGAGLLGADEARRMGLVPVPLALPGQPEAQLYLVVHRALRNVPRVAAVIEEIDGLVAGLESAV